MPLFQEKAIKHPSNDNWLSPDLNEAELLVDVYSEDDKIIVRAGVAGVRTDDLSIALDNDLLTIKGKRESDLTQRDVNYLYQECYWGAFSRSIVLPQAVDDRKVEAYIENGVLSIVLHKKKDTGNKIFIQSKD